MSSLCGKVLRLNPENGAGYTSNPYWDGNPGTVVIGDVGYNTWEEMNIVCTPGANFG